MFTGPSVKKVTTGNILLTAHTIHSRINHCKFSLEKTIDRVKVFERLRNSHYNKKAILFQTAHLSKSGFKKKKKKKFDTSMIDFFLCNEITWSAPLIDSI